MNWQKLFEIQAGLDEHIVETKGLQGQDLLDKKILALQVELGELANEWRGFKFWKVDPQPRTEIKRYARGSGKSEPPYVIENPLLEEYVDCLHFILSIGLDFGYENISEIAHFKMEGITSQFLKLNSYIADFHLMRHYVNYMGIVSIFVCLGEMLGFTEEQIEQAYLDKNKVNHERQNTGY